MPMFPRPLKSLPILVLACSFLPSWSSSGAAEQGGLLLKGTPRETSWRVLESGKPGPVVLILGGMPSFIGTKEL